MTITAAQARIIQARATVTADPLAAARAAICAQREAKNSRSAKRSDVAWAAHSIIGAAVYRSRTASHQVKSDLGRIMAESRHIGWVF